jgi:predicted Rossmann fold flavoprotein
MTAGETPDTPTRSRGGGARRGYTAAMSVRTGERADVVVVGAGAAGLAAAIFAARRLPGRRVVALDGAARLGAKILVAGGGRCNVTNRTVTPEDYCGGSRPLIRRVLAAFPVDATVAFFAELGVALHEEEHGKLFPDTNKAATVLHALLHAAEQAGVGLVTGCRVTGLAWRDDGCVVQTADGAIDARRVVLATGGLSLPKTGSDGAGYPWAREVGHTIVPTTPALVPLVLDGDFHAGVQGVAHRAEVAVLVEGQRPVRRSGDLLWTHFGVSGPVVLDVSRHWLRARLERRTARVVANLVPGADFAGLERRLIEHAQAQPRQALHNALATWLPARLADAVVARLGLGAGTPLAHLARDARRALVHSLVEWPLPVRDSRGYKFAEVTAGGVALDEVDAATMESRRRPGLHLVGEVLDVDGRIGGFNFQWAWSSGYVAGLGLARSLGGCS